MARSAAALLAFVLALTSCQPPEQQQNTTASYFDNTGRRDVIGGGSRMIPISTPSGQFSVWTKRIGNNPDVKILILHGGPGANHEYLEAVDSFFPGAGFEYYHYDQLGSFRSDQPADESLWEIPRFVEEVEQVRRALGLTQDNFYLFGHSWGGMLAIEYALKYQEHLKGLVISNMMSSIPAYNQYANEVLAGQMDPDVVAEIRAMEAAGEYENPRYVELVVQHYYLDHILRMPLDQWPDPVNRGFARINPDIYVRMNGPSEFGATGSIKDWDRSGDLGQIEVPTLVIGAEHDTMDPRHMEWMASQFPNGSYLYCPNGGHLALYDDQETYFEGLISFVRSVSKAQTASSGVE